MAALTVKIEGFRELERRLQKMNPKKTPVILKRGLTRVALQIQKNAQKEQIKSGGGGKRNASAPLPNRLTSRTGTGRRSIRVNRGPLPRAIEIGTDLRYMAAHERGGTFTRRSTRVAEHQRVFAFGRRVSSFTVPSHTRKAHSVKMPKRPFLIPAYRQVQPFIPIIFIREWETVAKL